MHLDELNFELPDDRIAQEPLPERDGARLLVLDRDGSLAHRRILDLPSLLPPSLFVVNDTRVIPARLYGRKPSGGKVELLLLERVSGEGTEERWRAMGRASKGLPVGTEVVVGGGALRVRVVGKEENGELDLVLSAADPIERVLERLGEVPLPPYIRREAELRDRERYQTVFAARPGAVAAPTAGLHLSTRLLDALAREGHRVVPITLHVGPGTFQPVKVEQLDAHRMHAERFEVPETTAIAIDEARKEGRAIVAVGTTVVRTLESAADSDGRVRAGAGSSSLFIRPPYRFRVVESLLTNFHLPRSTLLALVMALGGIDEVRAAYRAAVDARYRFFSYGDAMLLRGRAP